MCSTAIRNFSYTLKYDETLESFLLVMEMHLLSPNNFLHSWETPTTLHDLAELSAVATEFICPFLCAGERFHIVVHVSVHHPETTCTVTPYKVASAIQNLSHAADFGFSSKQDSMGSSHDTEEGNSRMSKTSRSARNALKGKWFNTTGGGNLVASTEWVEVGNGGLLSESRRRTDMLLESFKSSHFHVKIGRKGHRISVPQVVESGPLGLLHEEESDGENTAAALGCRTVLTEDGTFESTRAGGVARAATSCWSLGNGDVVVGLFILAVVVYILFTIIVVVKDIAVFVLYGPSLGGYLKFWILKEVMEDKELKPISAAKLIIEGILTCFQGILRDEN